VGGARQPLFSRPVTCQQQQLELSRQLVASMFCYERRRDKHTAPPQSRGDTNCTTVDRLSRTKYQNLLLSFPSFFQPLFHQHGNNTPQSLSSSFPITTLSS